LAPVAQLRHAYKPLEVIARLGYGMKSFVDELHIKNPLPIIRALKQISIDIGVIICTLNLELCHAVRNITKKLNTADLVFNEHPSVIIPPPDGTSIKNLYHYCQLFDSGKFQKFDYGPFGNLVWYSSLTPPHYSIRPPIYNLGDVDVPVVLFSGTKDIISATEDVQWIDEQLPNVLHNIILPHYGHISFIWSKTAYEKVFQRIVSIAESEMP